VLNLDSIINSSAKSTIHANLQSAHAFQSPPVSTIKDAEYDIIVETLTKTFGNMKKAAELLGISRRALYYKTEKYKINADEYR